jgi:hypothetical protein
MKPLQKYQPNTPAPSADAGAQIVRAAVVSALAAVDNARQQCIIAGYLLNEAKSHLFGRVASSLLPSANGRNQHSDSPGWHEWLEVNVPEVSRQTAETWMRAAANVAKALASDTTYDIEAEAIPMSRLLTAPVEELSDAAREYRQAWFDFTADKTIKDCLNAVTVDGDPAHRTDRAINGKTKGGKGGDRKAFERFAVIKLRELNEHLSHWKTMSALQRAEITAAFVAALGGGEVKPAWSSVPVKFDLWPADLCEAMAEALRLRLKATRSHGN